MNTIGFIGLGKMGQNIVLHLIEQGIGVVGYNRTFSVTESFARDLRQEMAEHAHLFTATSSLSECVASLPEQKIIILMIKAGEAIDTVLQELLKVGLKPGDIVIDGGNSFFKDSVKRQDMLKAHEIHYLDCGTSGGLEGARFGACLMIGGDKEIVMNMAWLWDAISGEKKQVADEKKQVADEKKQVADEKKQEAGGMSHESCNCDETCNCDESCNCDDADEALGTWDYMGPAGAGHFVKMVHNGVEYGINQAIGEGFHLLAEGPYKDLQLDIIANNWVGGSVVRSWLVQLLAEALDTDKRLSGYSGIVGGGETGEWTIATAKEHNIPQTVLEQALQARTQSQTKPTFATKVVSALRFGYGGHKEEKGK